MRVLLALAVWPLIEIGLFVVIGGRIGLLATLAVVLLSAVLGVLILRREAARGPVRLRRGLSSLRDAAAIGGGLFRGIAAVLLILPGFLTDLLGLILLLPPVQALLAAALLRKATAMGAAARHDDDVVEADWEEVPPPDRDRPDRDRLERPRRPSGWTQD